MRRIKNIYTISERNLRKKIYIYGLEKDAIVTFTYIVFHDANIEGFVDPSNRYIQKTFMNRQIISVEEFDTIENAILVLPDIYMKDCLDVHREYFYWRELLEINSDLLKKNLHLYGLGVEGERIYEYLLDKKREKKIKGVYVSTKGKYEYWNGIKVKEISEIQPDKNSIIVVATVVESYQKAMLKAIDKNDVDIYVNEMVFERHVINGTFFQSIAKAVRENKKIWIVGSQDSRNQLIKSILERYQVKIEGIKYINQESDLDKIYELSYENISDIMVVISESNEMKIEKICDILDIIGFSMEQFSYTSIFAVHTYKRRNAVKASGDCLLNISISNNKNFPGLVVLGGEKQSSIKILILGGSTSTVGVYRTKSWVEYLYQIMVDAGNPVTIYNAALCGAESVDELLHLLRDGDRIMPDYVINLSGVNDLYFQNIKNRFMMRFQHTKYAELGFCNGVESEESAYEFWLKMIRLKKLYSDFIHSKYFGFLQPINIAKENKNLFEAGMFENLDDLENAKLFKKSAACSNEKIYINLMDMFENKLGMYIDTCHYSNAANEIIAEKIYETMMKTEKEIFEKERFKRS